MTGGAPLPSGIRPLEALGAEEAATHGAELGAMVRLIDAGLPAGPGWVVRLADDQEDRLQAALRMALARGEVARIRPCFPSVEAAERFEREVGVPADVEAGDDPAPAAARLVSALRNLFGSGMRALAVRAMACDAHACGRAVSADTTRGDPDELGVWSREEPAAPWRIDRRTLRVTQRGGGLGAEDAGTVADLADRAQLVLGRPVQIEWCKSEGRFSITGLAFIDLSTTFGVGAWRRVALVAADEGTVAPLAVDALDRALGGDGSTHAAVRRIFARPYRQMASGVRRFHHLPGAMSLVRAGQRVTRVVADVAAPVAAAVRFSRAMRERLPVLDAAPLHTLEDALLVEAIRGRHALVADAFALLDRGREATGAMLAGLEATVGPLDRDAITALAAPRPTRWRQDVDLQLRDLAREIAAAHGRYPPVTHLDRELRSRWERTRRELSHVRPLGIDVRPAAIGESDASMRLAMTQAMDGEGGPSDGDRRRVARRVRMRARSRSVGRGREAMAGSLLLLFDRVARAKGATADDLAAALLRLRRAALVAGERLVERGMVEMAEDALYLTMVELEEALSDEPGAYAARARLRREDDARWARYEAPRRLEGRRAGPV